MATPIVLTNAYLSVGGTDISGYVTKITLKKTWDEHEVTVMGASAHNSIPGLYDWSIDVECNQDYTDNLLAELLAGWVGNSSAQAIIVKPNGGTTGVANPKWTGNGRIFEDTPIDGAVGDLAKVSFTIKPGDGAGLIRAVAD